MTLLKQNILKKVAAGRGRAADLKTDLNRARVLANWLDTKFEVGGLTFGLEGLVGLIPVVGDTLGVAAGVYPIYVAHRHGLGRKVQAQMAANLAVEWVGGMLPYVGDLFDVAFKANVKNFKLLEKAATVRLPSPAAPAGRSSG